MSDIPREQAELKHCLREVIKCLPESFSCISSHTGVSIESIETLMKMDESITHFEFAKLVEYFNCEYSIVKWGDNCDYDIRLASGYTLYPNGKKRIKDLYESLGNGGDTVFAIHLVNPDRIAYSNQRYLLLHTCFYVYFLIVIEGEEQSLFLDELVRDDELINFNGDRQVSNELMDTILEHIYEIKQHPGKRRVLDSLFFDRSKDLLFAQLAVSYPEPDFQYFEKMVPIRRY